MLRLSMGPVLFLGCLCYLAKYPKDVTGNSGLPLFSILNAVVLRGEAEASSHISSLSHLRGCRNIKLLALNHRNEEGMSFSKFPKLILAVFVWPIEVMLGFKLSKELLIPLGKTLNFFSEVH